MNGPVRDWLSARLLAMTTRLAPKGQRAWSDAMRAETAYLPPGTQLRWAFGCLVAAIRMRFAPMQTGSFRINRWVMLIETLAFVPLALGWLDVMFGQSGIIRLRPAMIEGLLSEFPGGTYTIVMWLLAGVVGLGGPIGLFAGLRYVILGRGLENRTIGWAMIAMLMVYGLTATAAALFSGPGAFKFGWDSFVLFGILPAATIGHLMYLARPQAGAPTDARLAAT